MVSTRHTWFLILGHTNISKKHIVDFRILIAQHVGIPRGFTVQESVFATKKTKTRSVRLIWETDGVFQNAQRS